MEVPELGHENDFGLQTRTQTCAHSHPVPQPAPWSLPLCQSQTRAPSLLFQAVSWPCCQHLSLCWMKLLGVGADFPPRAVGMQVSYKRNAGGQPARGACILTAMLMVTHWPAGRLRQWVTDSWSPFSHWRKRRIFTEGLGARTEMDDISLNPYKDL